MAKSSTGGFGAPIAPNSRSRFRQDVIVIRAQTIEQL